MRRIAAVPAAAGETDRPTARPRHERTFAESDSADRDAGHVVHAVDGVAGKSLEEAILEHGLRAA